MAREITFFSPLRLQDGFKGEKDRLTPIPRLSVRFSDLLLLPFFAFSLFRIIKS